MDERCAFLNRHSEIKSVVLLVGKEYSYDSIKILLKNCPIKKVILVGKLLEKKAKEIQRLFERDFLLVSGNDKIDFQYIKLEDFKCDSLDEECALCPEMYEMEDLKLLLSTAKEWKPRYLLATIQEGHISAFKIWEVYRDYCEYIQIKTIRLNKEHIMLDWKKNNDIELSVIFLLYNVSGYLEECIKSVTAWNAPYIEFLFVNDGSSDNSRDIVLEWAKRDARIKLLDKENGGCASARQFGLQRARGNYIGFIDPDDFIDESMFRKLFRAAMMGSYDVSYCGYNEFYEDTKEVIQAEDVLGWPYCDGCTDEKKVRELMMFSRVAIWRGIYKRDMIEKNHIHFYTDLRRFDDLPFKVEIFMVARSVVAIPEYLYYYRLSRPGQDVSANDERLYVHFDIFKYLNESIGKTYDARLVDYLQVCKIQTHLFALKKIKPEYRDVYLDRAKKDFLSTGNEERTYKIIRKWLGKRKADQFQAIMEKKFDKLFDEKEECRF